MACGDTENVILYGQQTEIWIWLNDLDTARVPINSLDTFRTEHAVMEEMYLLGVEQSLLTRNQSHVNLKESIYQLDECYSHDSK
jgi:hypothetical protein